LLRVPAGRVGMDRADRWIGDSAPIPTAFPVS
jgi:hypothetical protein